MDEATAAKPESLAAVDHSLAETPCFIERQFPVAKVSMESYKERSAKQSQTLTGLGKWWGRKPLVLVRATVLGLLMPASDDPIKDRDIFLKLLTMDDDGLWDRKAKSISQQRLLEELVLLPPSVQSRYLDPVAEGNEPRLRRLSREERADLQRLVFGRMSYSEKLTYCQRPEHLAGPPNHSWNEINGHLGTSALSLPDLVGQLGVRRFGRRPCVGDSFCGAGSIPFEAARIGCNAYASDLSPVATLLTWAAFNVIGGNGDLSTAISETQQGVFQQVDRQFADWGIEHNEYGWRADIYLYCVEVRDPETGWVLPLLPSRVVSKKYNTVATLVSNAKQRCYDVEIHSGVSSEEMKEAATTGTVADSRIKPPGSDVTTPIEMLRRSMRMWENDDVVPRSEDVFQERLYCVRWAIPNLEEALCLEQAPDHAFRRDFEQQWRAKASDVVDGLLPLLQDEYREYVLKARTAQWSSAANAILSARQSVDRLTADDDESERRESMRELGRARGMLPRQVEDIVAISKSLPTRVFRAPAQQDVVREQKVLALLLERFKDWQARGFVPSRKIESGAKTDEPIRTRGWTHWHHLFAPRQLLLSGMLLEAIWQADCDERVRGACLVSFSRCVDYNARLSRWHPRSIGDKTEQVFSNQALNTMWNYAVRGTRAIIPAFVLNPTLSEIAGRCTVRPVDTRRVTDQADLWITDPPYADAINYHELGEYFLAWYEKHLPKLFPDWYTDSKRALAVKADDPVEFKQSMVACYRRLAEHMPDNGLQVVMFTHQDAAVWADLTMILWAAAWCIATETDSALKQGNYVQGTVLLVCRKRTDAEPVFLDEIHHRVEEEVRRQLDEMVALDDASEPNFADADYQLAAYAAALRVLTERPIEEIDPFREIARRRSVSPRRTSASSSESRRDSATEESPVEQLIRNAVKIACDHLVPKGIEREVWKTFAPAERFYLKGLEVETHGEHRSGVYQELARGFGAADYDNLLESDRANKTRLKTAGEFGRRMLSGEGFASSMVRQVLFAVHQVTQSEETAGGLNWLRTELPDYWKAREKLIAILDCLARLDRVSGMDHWKKDSASARLLAGAVRNDHV